MLSLCLLTKRGEKRKKRKVKEKERATDDGNLDDYTIDCAVHSSSAPALKVKLIEQESIFNLRPTGSYYLFLFVCVHWLPTLRVGKTG